MNKQLKEFQDYLLKSTRIIALVGAGLSASSGLPVFRGSQGLWKNYNMIDLATPDAFYVDPGLVWQFYSWRRYSALQAVPNKGHLALSKLSKLTQNKQGDEIQYITITQNVDGLSSRSDHELSKLYEIHGSLFTLKCTSFSCNFIERNNFKIPLTKALEDTEHEYKSNERKRSRRELEGGDVYGLDMMGVGMDTEAISLSPQFHPVKSIPESELPRCPVCHALLRPGVVWFGESLPLHLITKIDNFIEANGKVDLILVIGTSGTVYPANSYVERVKYKGGKIAIFNTDIDEKVERGEVKDTWGFKGDAAELLPMALEPLIGRI